MAYTNLINAISAVVKPNGNGEITGQNMQDVLKSIVNTIGANATFAGIATPATVPPSTATNANVFYIASQNGTYTNFGGIVVSDEVAILSNASGSWAKISTEISNKNSVDVIADYLTNTPSIKVSEQGFYKNGVLGAIGTHSEKIYKDSINIAIKHTYFAQSQYDPITFFDANDGYVSSVNDSGGVVKSRTITANDFPENAVYVVLSADAVRIAKTANIIEKVDDIYTEYFSGVYSLIGSGAGYQYANIVKFTGIDAIKLRGKKIDVKIGEIISDGVSLVQYVEYDNDTQYIRRIFCDANTNNTFVVSDNSAIVEVRFYASAQSISSTLGFAYSVNVSIFKTVFDMTVEPEKKYWNDCRLLTYGDSITAINNGDFIAPFVISPSMTWGNRLAALSGFSTHYGRGIGSQTYVWSDNIWFANADGTYNSRPPAEQPSGTTIHKGSFCSWDRISTMIRADIKDNIDAIIIMGGTNDFGTNVNIEWSEPIFSANNNTDTDWQNADDYNGGDYDVADFCGAVASTIMKMQVRCPNAKIIVATPLPHWNSTSKVPTKHNNKTINEASQVIKKVASFMGVEVIDLNGECGINGCNYTTYITDGTHPYGSNGKTLMGNYFAQKINGIAKIK